MSRKFVDSMSSCYDMSLVLFLLQELIVTVFSTCATQTNTASRVTHTIGGATVGTLRCRFQAHVEIHINAAVVVEPHTVCYVRIGWHELRDVWNVIPWRVRWSKDNVASKGNRSIVQHTHGVVDHDSLISQVVCKSLEIFWICWHVWALKILLFK